MTIAIDSFDEAAAELRAKFFSIRETRPDSHLYVLLDGDCPVSYDHELHAQKLVARPVQRTAVKLTNAETSPLLLQFYRAGENGYVDEALVDITLSTAMAQCRSVNGSHVAAWVASDLEPHALAKLIFSACTLFDVNQGRQRFLPLYQPHRLALLFDEPQAERFLSHFLRSTHLWSFVDASGSLRCSKPSDADPVAPVVRLTLPQCRSQSRVALNRVTLLGLVKAGHEVPLHAERRIDDLLAAAGQAGLVHEEDIVFFALNGLTLSRCWYLHPEAQRCLALTRDEGASLPGLMAELPDRTLDEIGQFTADQ